MITIIVLTLVAAVLWILLLGIRKYKKRLTEIRDNANFRTYQGKAAIKDCNKKLDIINGFYKFKKK